MKRLTAFFMIFLMLTAWCVSAQETAEEQETAAFAPQLLYDIGVMPQSENGGANITRGEFAAAAAKLSGMDANAFSGECFADVSADYKYYNEILTAKFLGLAAGDKNGCFSPNDNILYKDAVEMLIKLLGYGEYEKVNGGVLSAGAKMGLTKGVYADFDGYLTLKSYAVLISNAVEIDIMEKDTEGTSEIKSGKTILTGYLGLTKKTGRVYACAYTALNGKSTLADDKFILESGKEKITVKCSYGKDDIFDFLGQRVEVYEKSGDEDEVAVSVRLKSDNVLTINSTNILPSKTGKTKVVYSADGSNAKQARISKQADVIYNKTALSEYTDRDFKISDGHLKLIDNDGNGEYETVIITEYSYTVARKVYSDDNYVSDKYGKTPLDLDDDSITFTDGEMPICAADINENDLIASQLDKNGRLISAKRLKNRYVGTVASVGEDSCDIDGKSYDLSAYYKKLAAENTEFETLKSGEEVCVCLDEYGCIAAVIPILTNTDMKYGFLVAVNESALGESEVKILTSGGKLEVSKLSDKIIIDGKSVKKACEYFTSTFGLVSDGGFAEIGKIIKYSKSADGYISKIDTEYESENEINALECDVQKASRVYSADAYSFSGYAIVNTSTLMFKVPSAASSNDKDYSLITPTSLTSGQSYTFSAYDMDRSGTAKALAVYLDGDTAAAIDGWDPVHMIDKILPVLNSDGEETKRIYTHTLNGEAQLSVKRELDISDLSEGDLIRVSKNYYGEVDYIEKVFQVKNSKTPYISHSNFTASYWFYYGKVIGSEGNTVKVSLSGDDSDLRYFDVSLPMTSRCHYAYDFDTKKVKTAGMENIFGAEDTDNPSWVLLYAWKGRVRDIFIYNNVK